MAKILIIEDNNELMESISDALELEGFEVIQASDGQTGIKLATEDSPDLILCDILMPEISGYEVIKKLKLPDGILPIPFIFITALAERKNFREGMELGADDYLVKPFTLEELFNAIKTRLAKQNSFENRVKQQIESIEKELYLHISELNKENEYQQHVINDLEATSDTITSELNEKKELLLNQILRSIEINITLQQLNKLITEELKKSELSDNYKRILIGLKNKVSKKSLLADGWTIFQLKFNLAYPNLASKIIIQFPQLTQQDLIIIFATLLNLNSNQIAEILNISPESVRKNKYRLKRKLGLAKSVDFYRYVHELSSSNN